ncbi:hypothetical protein E3Q23_02726 [Wallemia mellicola]|uniref:Phosphatases II n=1 Tax=Wallemia mellicola TaxID=1708541 RepID=A0A4T0SMY1_9BASI|nr:hypothetical protein E3Q23_02726 [Wallemia mellicola]TIC53522.1 phosphatases II [Wallemia mellicola]TIC64146.1 phosphatases II [Wallemia mellicola]
MTAVHLKGNALDCDTNVDFDNDLLTFSIGLTIATPAIQFVSLEGIKLTVGCRNLVKYTLSFSSQSISKEYFSSLKRSSQELAAYNDIALSIYDLPAFKSYKGRSSGWSIYNPTDEFRRQGVLDNPAWRTTSINKSYTLCPTYPSLLVVPTKISDNVLNYAARYRSRQRLPVLTYHHWNNRATITRCAQPLVGLTNNRSIQDEKLVEALFTSHLGDTKAHGATATNIIVDARPTTNAMAQRAQGAGTENMDNYPGCQKVYLGIENIHVVRDAYTRVVDAVGFGNTPGGQVDRVAVGRSGYLKHIAVILSGTLLTVRNIHVHSSHVLVHCSDGWDRTSQVAALAQICLDPYFRTLRGLIVLIEKDFLAFGHKFNERCGHTVVERPFYVDGVKEPPPERTFGSRLKEVSPVFLQFLDCLWQLIRQNPGRFEYNEDLLRVLLEKVYSCDIGSFLVDSERERMMVDPLDGQHRVPVVEATESVWDEILTNMSKYTYEDYSEDDKVEDMGVLYPRVDDILWWNAVFGQGTDLNSEIEPETPPQIIDNAKGKGKPYFDTLDSFFGKKESVLGRWGGMAGVARGIGTQVQNFGQGLVHEYNNFETRFGGLRIDDQKDLPPRLRSDYDSSTLFDEGEDTRDIQQNRHEIAQESVQNKESTKETNKTIKETNKEKDPLGVAFM